MAKAVFGLVDNEFQAERVVDELRAGGFSNNDISVLFPDKSGTRDFAHEQHTKAPEGAATGAGMSATGGAVGSGTTGAAATGDATTGAGVASTGGKSEGTGFINGGGGGADAAPARIRLGAPMR